MEKETFQEFEGVSYEAWKRLAEKTLKGKAFDSLLKETYETIMLKPLYTKEDAYTMKEAAALLPEAAGGIAQEISAHSPHEANRALLQAIEHGQAVVHVLADCATLHGSDSDESEGALQSGIPLCSKEDIESAFNEIDLSKYPVLLYTGYVSSPLLAMILSYGKEKGFAFESMRGTIGADPLGYLAENGVLPIKLEECYEAMSRAILWSKLHAPKVKTVFVRTDAYHNAGANAVQEMAAALATAVEYMREGMKRGLEVDAIARQFTFSFSAGTHLFTEIAKLRAIRVLWKKAAESFGVADGKTHIHVRTSKRTKTQYDPYVNLLRATTEAFSAITGGADTLHVSTYDEAFGVSRENSERWARNIQHILCGESHLAKVLDPARGSYYAEALTKELAEQAWNLFRRIEEKGGMSIVLKQGWFQEEIAKVAVKRLENVSSLGQKIVGINVYVNKAERKASQNNKQNEMQQRVAYIKQYKEQRNPSLQHPVEKAFEMNEMILAFTKGATIGEITSAWKGEGEKVQALQQIRDAEPFEALREAAEKYERLKGTLPQAAIVQIGEEQKTPPYLVPVLEGCGFAVKIIRAASGKEIAAADANILFAYGSEEDLQAAKFTAKKVVIVGKHGEKFEKQMLEAGVTGFIDKPSALFPFLHELHNELEVIV